MTTEQGKIETEAAIYAEGTPYTRDDLMAAWRSLTAEQQEETTVQRFFAEFIADASHGDLHDYHSGEYLRPATRRERDNSRAAGPEGVILVSGRRCYVQE